ncbi:MAG: holo-ACP synthase [Dehalococcoidales bacterium]|nr:holo-ACP synthase [Dehalococcoidales bacterium]
MRIEVNKFGIGVDIENIDRFAGSDFVRDSAIVNSIFTQSEQEYCFLYKIAAPHLAARYCAKEAITKALASIGTNGINYKDIEIINEQAGPPVAVIEKEGVHDLQVYLSLSHCNDKAVAFAVIIRTI